MKVITTDLQDSINAALELLESNADVHSSEYGTLNRNRINAIGALVVAAAKLKEKTGRNSVIHRACRGCDGAGLTGTDAPTRWDTLEEARFPVCEECYGTGLAPLDWKERTDYR